MADIYQFWLICGSVLLGLGILSGLLAGLFGVGGGIVLVPGILMLFHFYPITGWPVHVAVATSLANIIFTGSRSALSHHRRGNVDWRIVQIFAPAIMIGAVFGAVLAEHLETHILQIIFSGMLFMISILLLIKPIVVSCKLPSAPVSAGFSGLIGMVSSLIGIGGGSLVVPLLTMCSTPMIRAVGSAAALGIAIAIPASIGFAITGWNKPELPPYSIGFIWLPGLLITLISSISVAPIGSWLASILPAQQLRRAFAVFLMIVSVKLAIEA